MSSLQDTSSLIKKLTKRRPSSTSNFLYPDGNEGLSPNAIGDYSITPQTFSIELNAGSLLFGDNEWMIINAFGVSLNAGNNPVKEDYGVITDGLTAGYTFDIYVGPDSPFGELQAVISNPIFNNFDLFTLLQNFNTFEFSGSTEVTFFGNAAGANREWGLFIPLHRTWSAELRVDLSDDFSDLTEHFFSYRGFLTNNIENWVENGQQT